MDIRNYFSPVGGNKSSKTNSSKESKKKPRIIDSDDEEPIPSSKKRQKIIDSDSDDDIFESSKPIKKPTPKGKQDSKEKKKKSLPKPETPKLKPASVTDFFGSSPIVRKNEVKKKTVNEVEVHDDDDFEKTLSQLDEHDIEIIPATPEKDKLPKVKVEKETIGKSSSPKKESIKDKAEKSSKTTKSESPNENNPPKESKSKGSLASKLSAKIREQEIKEVKREKTYDSTPKKNKHLSEEKEKSHSQEKKRKHSEERDGYNKTPDKSHDKKQKYSSEDSRSSKSKHTPLKDKDNIKKEVSNRIPAIKDEKKITPKKEEKEVTPKKVEKKISPKKEEKKTPKKEEKKLTPKKEKEEVKEESIEETTPQPDEKKKNARAAYFKYLQRSGPSNPGSKPIPVGAPECLQGLVFVLTGVLDSLDREETSELIKKYGGKVTSSISRNTSYLIVGNEAGESKLKKAQQIGTKQLSEDELLEMIRTRPGKGVPEKKDSKISSPAANKLKAFEKASDKTSISSSHSQKSETASTKSDFSPKNVSQSSSSSQSSVSSPKTQPIASQDLANRPQETLMWVDKYKPANLKNVIGQQGDRSNVKKLFNWLINWKKNHSGEKKLVRPSPWAKDDNGAFFKCALLSGPPGVGKTTSAHLVCKEAGFDFVELNASDARSKRTLDQVVSELLTNKNLAKFAGGKGDTNASHVLVMDEVDGMSGNEDRGGVQELIALIKKSKVPIITMCNDRNHPKIRSLANHCFDLRYSKPRIEQIRGPMMSVCFREGIKIKPDALDQIIIGANQDIRQILHHLSMWSANQETLAVNDMKVEAQKAKKDFKLGPWDVCKKVFSESDHKTMSIYDKSDLFFHDYSIASLFVQENYPKAVPHIAQGNRRITLEQLAKAANSLADGDLVEKGIRSRNAWSLLPVQAMYSSVLPGEYMSGHLSSQIEFPKWLGNNSRRNKFDRLMQDLQKHMRLKISGNKLDVGIDYCEPLKRAICLPLINEGNDGVSEAVDVMNDYHLLREDLDSILELSTWPGSKDIMSKIDSKVKASFTRAYNKEGHLTPFAAVSAPKKKKGGGSEDMYGEGEEEEEEDNDDDDISKDAMIKVKKGGAKGKNTDSKGKGRGASAGAGGRGRGRGKK